MDYCGELIDPLRAEWQGVQPGDETQVLNWRHVVNIPHFEHFNQPDENLSPQLSSDNLREIIVADRSLIVKYEEFLELYLPLNDSALGCQERE